jgi:hypothetical protein
LLAGVQNPAVLPAPPTTAMSNVSALSARSPSEHVAPEANSLTVDAPSAEPATPDAVTRNDSNETKTESAQPDTTLSVPEPKVEPTARDKKPDTTAKHTDKPKVRGPIEFDSQKTPTESPSTPSGEEPTTAETSQTETSSTPTSDSDSAPDSEHMDAA